MIKLNLIHRITFTALFLALYIVATRFLGFYITPYVRLSLGIPILIFSSLLVGPICGAAIGGLGDIFGILIFNSSGVAINYFITITYTIMGAIPALFLMLFKKIKINNSKRSFLVLSVFLILIWVGILIFSLFTKSIKIFNQEIIFNTIIRVLIPIISFVLMVLILIFIFFFNRHFKKKIELDSRIISPYEIAFIVVFIQIVFTLLINTLVKSLFYEVPFEIIFFPALLLSFIYIPLNTFIVTYLSFLTCKIKKE